MSEDRTNAERLTSIIMIMKNLFLQMTEGVMGEKQWTLDKTEDNLIAWYIHTVTDYMLFYAVAFYLISIWKYSKSAFDIFFFVNNFL